MFKHKVKQNTGGVSCSDKKNSYYEQLIYFICKHCLGHKVQTLISSLQRSHTMLLSGGKIIIFLFQKIEFYYLNDSFRNESDINTKERITDEVD